MSDPATFALASCYVQLREKQNIIVEVDVSLYIYIASATVEHAGGNCFLRVLTVFRVWQLKLLTASEPGAYEKLALF